MYESQYPLWAEYCEGRVTGGTANEFFLTPCKDIIINPLASGDTDGIWNASWSGGNGRNIMTSITGTFSALISGRSPHGVIPIPMGRLMDPTTWWAVNELGSARIKMVTGAGDVASLYELLLQQLRKY